jgi:hypothetical protein
MRAPAPPAPAPGCSSGSWTRRLQEFTCQMGIPTGFRVALQYGHNWNSSWTYTVGIPTGVWVKMWNREHRCNFLKFSRTEEFEELLPAWMRTVLEHSSFHYWFRQISRWNCLPAKHSDQGGRGERNLRKRCSNFTTRSISKDANILALINRIPIYIFCLPWWIWFHLVTGLDHSSLPFRSDFEELLRKYLPSNCIM